MAALDFGFLSSHDIKTLSVKKIQNSTTFDTLLHPVPGGLYDAALGAWADNPCATCHLNTYACPGHAGHIELPVPVYHVTFMDQLLRLLKAQCAYCSHLRLHGTELNRYICKLRLIRHGLLREAQELEENVRPKGANVTGISDLDDQAESDDSENEDDITEQRNKFVKEKIRAAGGRNHRAAVVAEKVEAISEERRRVVKEFLGNITKVKSCGRCNGISPSYRKDRYSKIFRKSLRPRDKAKMAQGGFKAVNPLIRAFHERKASQKQKLEDREVDEGIVADIEDQTSEEDGEDLEMMDLGSGLLNENLPNGTEGPARMKSKTKELESDMYVNAQEVHALISDLFRKEKEIVELLYSPRLTRNAIPVTADMFFIRIIFVPPNRFRPEAKTGEGEIAEAQQNTLYKQILTQCEALNQIRKEMSGSALDLSYRQRDFRDLQNVWVLLQDAVNSLIDRDRNPIQGLSGRQTAEGIKQLLEKKDGLFRKNMMGKRVNFAARSVISPDPNIETNEIGVPPVFAKKLTYPEPVTNHNFYELKEAVLNGVEKWPGAAAIENENGQVINLRTKNFEERQALANQLLAPSSTNVTGARNKKVHRHLNNGDIVLMNRQPTLHKPSIMAHRARVLPGEKTIRMHYANCNTYNADFDGDEMNMHFPQNEIARSEALQIADTDHQYLVATSGKPLRGLIQDHISMGVWLTNRDTFFDREDYYQLLYACLRPENNHTTSARIETVKPAIFKPRAMWTGKQIISSVMRNITPITHEGLNLTGKSQTTGDRWGDQLGEDKEDKVIFYGGDLLCGILDKAHLGPSGGGFVHSVYEAYGHTIAGKLLSVLGRLLTKFLHMRAFTCGMDDLVLTEKGEKDRIEKLREVETIGFEVATKYVTLDTKLDASNKELLTRLQDVLRDEEKQAGLDSVVNSRTATLSSSITTACLPAGLRKPFPKNQMQAMTTSGAKGSSVNANLISCNLGQQVLEGRRVPVMVSGKTLPSFKPFETNVRAGGYITDRFLTGVKPQEYYFHAMAGREGLIDTAVKTSRSGYLQRCLIKGMEGLKVEYDSSVRDSDGTMVQFLYGEDGLDITKQKHLRDFKFLAENYMSLVAQLNVRDDYPKTVNAAAGDWHKQAMKMVRGGRVDAIDPALAIFNPGSCMGSTSETFASALRTYCDANPENRLRDKKKPKASNAPITKKTFNSLLDMKYMKSVVDPGEAVGIVAGQSIGEPSTQMTLNTFHLAGHSVKNVTLGIPRLREIVMTASNRISTPTMTLHLNPELTEDDGQHFAKLITKLTLAEVIEDVHVSEAIGPGTGYSRAKIYDIGLDLFPSSEYCETYAIGVSDVLRVIEYKFIPQLAKAIKRELIRKGDAKLLKPSAAQPEIGKSTGIVEDAPSRPEAMHEGGDDDENDDGDDDATNNKQRQNRDETVNYAAPDEEEEAIARDAHRESTPDTDTEDEGLSGSPRESTRDEDDGQDQDQDQELEQRQRSNNAKERLDRIMTKNPSVTHFSFDPKTSSRCQIRLEYDVSTAKLLLLSLIESTLHTTLIQHIPGLVAATSTTEKSPGTEAAARVVLTQGVNLRAMHGYQHILNPHKLFTNDIGAMLIIYGVEACRATIIREMDSVFKGHSITVDNRHLNLIADVMTQGGGFKAFNRMGLKGATSPFMKMSFETTVGFLKEAVLEGDWDDLKGPSGRIVVGRVSGVGTGGFDVLMPVGENGEGQGRDGEEGDEREEQGGACEMGM